MKQRRTKPSTLSSLDALQFGLPEKRKYPLDTINHVRLVIKYFYKVNQHDKEEVASNIFRRMNDLNMSIAEELPADSPLLPYVSAFSSSKEMFFASPTRIDDKDSISTFYSSLQLAIQESILQDSTLGPYAVTKRVIYTKQGLDVKFAGNVSIYIFNTLNNYEWQWIVTRNKEMIENTRVFLKNLCDDYKNKIIKLGMKHKMMLVPRLSFDKHNSVFMRFNPSKDKVMNLANLNTYISEDTFLTSDLHFGKYGVLEDNKIITMINASVQEDDVLVILGDIGYINNINKAYLKSCITRIKCKNKFLILGNHDLFTLDFYYGCGFLSIYERFFSKDHNWILSHQPCNSPNAASINFHGHLHNSNKYPTTITNLDKKINCYYRRYPKILQIKDLLKLIEKEP